MTFGLFACSTKKKSFTHRAYHNTTAKYNGFFNAREIIRANVASTYNQYQNDYSELIPLFIFPTEAESKSMFPDMDKVIEKCSDVIERHSIYIKKKEYNSWIDDSYMLIGRARFYKQEYFAGIEIFEYIAKAYKNKPEKYEALMWLIKTHMQLDDLDKAEAYLNNIEDGKAIPKKYSSEYNALFADFYIKKKNYDDAIKKLEKSLQTTKNKKVKRRYTYVLAQLWLKKGQYTMASEAFTEVIRLKPEYDMMFNAKINRALSYDVSSAEKDEVKKMLTKMVRDSKNKEFLDQIYYALADIAFKEDDEPLGIDYLKKSAAASISNNKQKALSYLRLGELYFSKPEYIPAASYYDSCLTVLPKEYVDYDKIEVRKKNLTKLVTNIKIVALEDSLQLLANNKSLRDKTINDLIKKERKKEEEKRQEDLAQENSDPTDINVPRKNTTSNKSSPSNSWYFYNATIVGFGFSDFQKSWGDRKLEDNWRRSNKQSVASFDAANEDESLATDTGTNELTNPNYYLKFFPLTDEKIETSNNKIIEALYAIGNIYREDFTDYPRSIEAFETLVTKYDTCKYKLPSWYNLYRISLLIDDDEMKEKYKRLILNNYPNSEYASIIQDPSYNKVVLANRKRVDNYYSQVYNLYKKRSYSIVLLRCEKAKTIFADNHLQDKFDFLAAMAIGNTSPRDTFKLALENIITKHPESEVSTEAKTILALMAKKERPIPAEEKPLKSPYKYNASNEHLFIIVVPNINKKINSYKSSVSDFNQKYYRAKSFKLSSIFLDPTNQIITIKSFKGAKEAMEYYQ